MKPVLEPNRKWEKLERVLAANLDLDQSAIQVARDLKKQKGGLMGEAFVELGRANHDQVVKALADQQGIAFYKEIESVVDAELADACGFIYLMENSCAPVLVDENIICAVTSDPMNLGLLNDLSALTEKMVIPGAAPKGVVERKLLAYFEDSAIGSTQEDVGLQADDQGDLSVRDLIEDTSSEAPFIKFVNAMLVRAARERASDIHVEPNADGAVIRFRVDGVLQDIKSIPGKKAAAAISSRLKVMSALDISEKRKPQDGRFHIKAAGRDIDVRISTIPTTGGERCVLRILERKEDLYSLEKLGFSGEIEDKLSTVTAMPHGIFLITGPTGSGKTTTLYSMLGSIDRQSRNVLTIEDPVEYDLDGVGQIAVNAKAGVTFETGLRSILRQDPDVVMIGEIRDTETARIAVQAAMTGHLVFATLHTNDAASALVRLVDMGIEPFLVTSAVRGVLAQRLVRRLCDCKEESLDNIPVDLYQGTREAAHYKAVGCEACRQTGYHGRVAVSELLEMSDSIKRAFLEGDDASSISKAAVKSGMRTLAQDASLKLGNGLTSAEEIIRAVSEQE